ncbi:MAG: hypothetical protein NZZ41_03040 [Candidatus Dojkabacteria bacterium]|nr:hypothetical protein [Candidatus Dojkabacteria bacterium]
MNLDSFEYDSVADILVCDKIDNSNNLVPVFVEKKFDHYVKTCVLNKKYEELINRVIDFAKNLIDKKEIYITYSGATKTNSVSSLLYTYKYNGVILPELSKIITEKQYRFNFHGKNVICFSYDDKTGNLWNKNYRSKNTIELTILFVDENYKLTKNEKFFDIIMISKNKNTNTTKCKKFNITLKRFNMTTTKNLHDNNLNNNKNPSDEDLFIKIPESISIGIKIVGNNIKIFVRRIILTSECFTIIYDAFSYKNYFYFSDIFNKYPEVVKNFSFYSNLYSDVIQKNKNKEKIKKTYGDYYNDGLYPTILSFFGDPFRQKLFLSEKEKFFFKLKYQL